MTTEEKRRLGEKIRQRRLKKGLSQGGLAKKIGLPAAVISHWETGLRVPRLSNLEKIAAGLNCSVSTLIK